MIFVRSRGRLEALELEEFEDRVREGRVLPSTLVRFPVVTGDDFVRAEELDVFRRLYAPARLHFVRSFNLSRFPYFTLLLCLGQIALFLTLAGPNRFIGLDPLIEAGAKARPNILELGQTWRLFTANVLHRDVLHLFFNSFFLFNLGGTIENAFRLRDYAWILLVSGLFATALSTVMSSVPSVGASGMILGLFGSAATFGYKYGALLPRRYRHYFGGAVLPYALFILYVGLATRDTDNWGHLGGLLGGLLATLPLQPRQLLDARRKVPAARRYGTLVGSAALCVLVLALGPVIRRVGLVFEPIQDQRSGIAFVYPAYWQTGENHLGYPAKGNTLGTAIGVRAETRSSAPYSERDVRTWFFDQELRRLEARGDITNVQVLRERPFAIEGARATEVIISLESRAGPQLSRNIIIERGYYRYAIVLSAPVRWSKAYASLLDRLVSEIRLVEPRALSEARAVTRRFPRMTSAHYRLGNEFARIGAVEEARGAYLEAQELTPGYPPSLYGLAKLEADFDGDLRSAASMAQLLFEREPSEPAYAALLADLRRRLGEIEAACETLQTALDSMVEVPAPLRDRVIALRCFRRI